MEQALIGSPKKKIFAISVMGKTILTSIQKKVLHLLSKDNIFAKDFYLTGGTALAEYYLHHRFSEDLDFFSCKEIEPLWLVSIAKRIKIEIGAEKAKELKKEIEK